MAKDRKTGGRKRGTPNKKTQILKELIEETYEDFNPILELIAISKKDNTPDDLKVSIYKEVAQYLYPKRKALEAEIIAEIDRPKTIEEVIFEIKRENRKN